MLRFWTATGLIQYLCFAIFGALTARHISDDWFTIAGGVFLGIILAVAGSFAMAGFLSITNPQVQKQHGFMGLWRSVNTGFIMLVPFTLLAMVSELALDWSAVQVFASAGIMTVGATIGVEMSKLGKHGFITGLLPSAAAFALSATCMALGTLARFLAG